MSILCHHREILVSMMFQRKFVLTPDKKVANNIVTCLVRGLALLGSDIIWLGLLKRIVTSFVGYTCNLNFTQYHINIRSMLGSCTSRLLQIRSTRLICLVLLLLDL